MIETAFFTAFSRRESCWILLNEDGFLANMKYAFLFSQIDPIFFSKKYFGLKFFFEKLNSCDEVFRIIFDILHF
jgi:hypothetical protein